MKKHQFTLNWYHLWIENPSQWTILEPLRYSNFVFATLVHGVIGYKFCWLLPLENMNQLIHQVGTNQLPATLNTYGVSLSSVFYLK